MCRPWWSRIPNTGRNCRRHNHNSLSYKSTKSINNLFRTYGSRDPRTASRIGCTKYCTRRSQHISDQADNKILMAVDSHIGRFYEMFESQLLDTRAPIRTESTHRNRIIHSLQGPSALHAQHYQKYDKLTVKILEPDQKMAIIAGTHKGSALILNSIHVSSENSPCVGSLEQADVCLPCQF